MPRPITEEDLLIHVLNVGFGDSLIIELPKSSPTSPRQLGIVDCYKGAKTIDYLDKIHALRPIDEVAFVCATHPHSDHVGGLRAVIRHLVDPGNALPRPLAFWDSGFRHQSATYIRLLEAVRDEGIAMTRVSSGMEWYFGRVRISALAPSVALRNRYSTYGVDINNASIILRLEYCEDDVVTVESLRYRGTMDPSIERKEDKKRVAILGADAEFDSWAKVAEEFPHLHTASEHDPLVKKVVNLLNCYFLKVSHHGSMHSAPLDVLERQAPTVAGISNSQKLSSIQTSDGTFERPLFPHNINLLALREVDAEILTTDERKVIDPETGVETTIAAGSLVAVIPPSGNPKMHRGTDTASQMADPPDTI